MHVFFYLASTSMFLPFMVVVGMETTVVGVVIVAEVTRAWVVVIVAAGVVQARIMSEGGKSENPE